MNNFIEKCKSLIKIFYKKCCLIFDLFIATDMPLYSTNAAFFIIITGIPLFMLIFSTLSLVPDVKVDDIVEGFNLLFPNLPYVKTIVNHIVDIASKLSTSNIISINIIIAIITGSTTLYTFTIGIRKIHNITHKSGFLRLRFLAIINMFIFFCAMLIMLISFLLGSMIIGYLKEYIPFAEEIVHKVFNYKYIVAFIILTVFMLSIYSTSTNFERKIRHNILGSTIATIIWLLISNLFSMYFKTFPLSASIYGSLTGIIVVLLWILVCMHLIFLGSVVNEVYYPHKRIMKEQRDLILKEFEKGNDEVVDSILNERYRLTKIHDIKRPTLNKNFSYDDEDKS